MDQSPSLEANSCLANQEIIHLLQNSTEHLNLLKLSLKQEQYEFCSLPFCRRDTLHNHTTTQHKKTNGKVGASVKNYKVHYPQL
jgi:hypothetical protein